MRPPVTLTFRTRVDICYRFVEVDILHVLFMFGRVWWIREFIMIFFSLFWSLSRPPVTLTFRTRVDVCYRFVEVDILHVLFMFGRVWWIREFIMIFFLTFWSLSRPPVTLTFRTRVDVCYRFVEVDILHVLFKFGRVWWFRKFIMNFFHFFGPF
jgi:hypothetical protein